MSEDICPKSKAFPNFSDRTVSTISEDTYECLVTNLPEENFPVEKLKEIYNSRWGDRILFSQIEIYDWIKSLSQL